MVKGKGLARDGSLAQVPAYIYSGCIVDGLGAMAAH